MTTNKARIGFLEVQATLNEHPKLHHCGYGNLHMRSERFTVEQINAYRVDMVSAESVQRIDAACAWIEHYLSPIATINKRWGSYGLKHLAEPTIGYVTNGQFIVALLLAGYQLEPVPNYNPSFNISQRSIRAAIAANQQFAKMHIYTDRNRQEFIEMVQA